MAKNIIYGIGGYDPTKSNNNVLEEIDVPDVVEETVALPAPTIGELTEVGNVAARLFDPKQPDPTLAEQVHAVTAWVQQIAQQI